MHVKTGDKVQVIAGKDKGGIGSVVRIDSRKGRVVVEGLNMVKRHKKPGADGSEGGIIDREAFLDASNVLLYSEKLERGVRTQVRYLGKDGSQFPSKTEALASFGDATGKVTKVRFCAKTGEVFE
ncbi:MAG: 50S ribosomal protein L24 [Bradymonadia bacterium]